MSFKVRVKPSGHEFSVEQGENILQAALRAGYGFPYGCRNGSCGSCKGKLLEGDLDYGVYQDKALSEAERAAGYALFCQAQPRTDVTLEVREIDSASGIVVKILPCRVAKLEQLAHDVVRVYLKLPASERLQFFAGQYIDILLREGRRRSFSIANAPHDDEFIELHIRLIEGGRLTGDIFHNLKEKAILRIQGPLGNFYLREDSDRPIILVAGGTGFGPIKGIVEHALAKGIQRPIHLYWGARAKRDLYLDELARGWAEQHAHIRYTPVLSQPLPEDHWQGRQGYVPRAVLDDFPDLSEYEVYASGPPAMVHAGHVAFTAHGLLLENFYSDPFEFAQDPVPVVPNVAG
ncbi:MAG TPA: CDP-6-deoxy-delta-3,4-glucoseen reductase [Gammaproteobacteria bacterium]|nr:CDP-6-deoxy-delta-3,4-glucoseen reductase [Gammaproteobacteria bacterium]